MKKQCHVQYLYVKHTDEDNDNEREILGCMWKIGQHLLTRCAQRLQGPRCKVLVHTIGLIITDDDLWICCIVKTAVINRKQM